MQSIKITVGEESKELNPAELADFLFLFRATNLALHQLVPPADQKAMREPLPDEVERYRVQLTKFTPKQLDSFFDAKTEPELLQIKEMSRQSPLWLVYLGCPMLITLAVVFSGGKISLKVVGTGIEADIKSLGEGIKSLREALGLGKRLKASYGIRSTVVKLTKEEYKALMLQDPSTKSNGGFQGFLVGLQGRVKRQTLELELSERDLERIYRYKANPRKGGWQSRFNKIFSRVFNDDEPKQKELLPPEGE
jgi:hypothetical protein